MTAEGAGSQGGHWAARPWRAARQLSARTPLRTKLITALLGLVVVALAAISVSGGWLLRSYLTTQYDSQLQSVMDSISTARGSAVVPGEIFPAHGNILAGVEQPGTPLSPGAIRWPWVVARLCSSAVDPVGADERGLGRRAQRKAGDGIRPVRQR